MRLKRKNILNFISVSNEESDENDYKTIQISLAQLQFSTSKLIIMKKKKVNVNSNL